MKTNDVTAAAAAAVIHRAYDFFQLAVMGVAHINPGAYSNLRGFRVREPTAPIMEALTALFGEPATETRYAHEWWLTPTVLTELQVKLDLCSVFFGVCHDYIVHHAPPGIIVNNNEGYITLFSRWKPLERNEAKLAFVLTYPVGGDPPDLTKLDHALVDFRAPELFRDHYPSLCMDDWDVVHVARLNWSLDLIDAGRYPWDHARDYLQRTAELAQDTAYERPDDPGTFL